jgi:hypothetical protein
MKGNAMWLLRLAAVCFEIFTVAGAAIGATFLASGLLYNDTAMAQGASAAIAVACVALPYCVAGILHRAASRLMQQQIIDIYQD